MSNQQIHRIMIITRSVLFQKNLTRHVEKSKILQEIVSTQWFEQGLVRFYTASVIQPRFALGGENLLREQCRRKDTIKAPKIIGFYQILNSLSM